MGQVTVSGEVGADPPAAFAGLIAQSSTTPALLGPGGEGRLVRCIELEVKKPPTGFEKRSLSRGTAGIPDLASRAGTRAPGYSMPCTLM